MGIAPKAIGTLRDGKPTGCLAEGTMEINVETWTGKEWIHYGTKYVPLSEEVRTLLERGARPQVMSMGAVSAEAIKAAEADMLERIGLGPSLEPGMGRIDFEPVRTTALEDALPSNTGRFDTALPPGYRDAAEDRGHYIDGVPTVTGGTYAFSMEDLGLRVTGNIDASKTVNYTGAEPLTFRATGEDKTPQASAFYAPGQEPKPYILNAGDEGPAFLALNASKPLEHSGFNVNYYSIEIKNPKREGKAPYTFEVEDLIEALNLTFHEGNVLKSLVRSANERNHGVQKQGSDYIRDAEKMVHSSKEELRRRKLRAQEGKK